MLWILLTIIIVLIIINPLLFDQNNLTKGNLNDLTSTNALKIKTSLSAPLTINGEFYGMTNIDNKTRIDAFNKKDIQLITYIARELEIAIKNVTLMNELVDALKIDKLTNIKIAFSAGICENVESLNLDKIITSADNKMYMEKRNKNNPQ